MIKWSKRLGFFFFFFLRAWDSNSMHVVKKNKTQIQQGRQKMLQHRSVLHRERQWGRHGSTARRTTTEKYACYQVKLKRIQQSMLGWANTCEWRCVLLCPVRSCRWSGSSFLYVPTKHGACSSVHHLKHTDLSACNHQSSSLLPENIEHFTVTLASPLD